VYLPKAGDIFCLPLTPTEWLSGRVLLDIGRQCVAPHRLPAGSPLANLGDTLLVEIHGEPVREPCLANERILVPSAYVSTSSFANGGWTVIDESSLNPEAVSFPATLTGGVPTASVIWGEVSLRTAISIPEFVKLGFLRTVHQGNRVPAKCLVELGRADELDPARHPSPDALRFSNNDLRLSEKGREIMANAGLPPNPRYYDEAAARGIDTRRFYDPDPRIPVHVCLECLSRRTPARICWACGVDTDINPLLETSEAELAAMPRKACPSCATLIPKEALRCATCRTEQP
jgi:hypothetical protein